MVNYQSASFVTLCIVFSIISYSHKEKEIIKVGYYDEPNPEENNTAFQVMTLEPRTLSPVITPVRIVRRRRIYRKPVMSRYPKGTHSPVITPVRIVRQRKIYHEPVMSRYPKGAVYTRYKVPKFYITYKCPPRVGLYLCRKSCRRRSSNVVGSCDNGYCVCLLLTPGFRKKRGILSKRANCSLKEQRVKCNRYCKYQFGRNAYGSCRGKTCRCFTNPVSPGNPISACQQAQQKLRMLENRLRHILRKPHSVRTPADKRLLQQVSKSPGRNTNFRTPRSPLLPSKQRLSPSRRVPLYKPSSVTNRTSSKRTPTPANRRGSQKLIKPTIKEKIPPKSKSPLHASKQKIAPSKNVPLSKVTPAVAVAKIPSPRASTADGRPIQNVSKPVKVDSPSRQNALLPSRQELQSPKNQSPPKSTYDPADGLKRPASNMKPSLSGGMEKDPQKSRGDYAYDNDKQNGNKDGYDVIDSPKSAGRNRNNGGVPLNKAQPNAARDPVMDERGGHPSSSSPGTPEPALKRGGSNGFEGYGDPDYFGDHQSNTMQPSGHKPGSFSPNGRMGAGNEPNEGNKNGPTMWDNEGRQKPVSNLVEGPDQTNDYLLPESKTDLHDNGHQWLDPNNKQTDDLGHSYPQKVDPNHVNPLEAEGACPRKDDSKIGNTQLNDPKAQNNPWLDGFNARDDPQQDGIKKPHDPRFDGTSDKNDPRLDPPYESWPDTQNDPRFGGPKQQHDPRFDTPYDLLGGPQQQHDPRLGDPKEQHDPRLGIPYDPRLGGPQQQHDPRLDTPYDPRLGGPQQQHDPRLGDPKEQYDSRLGDPNQQHDPRFGDPKGQYNPLNKPQGSQLNNPQQQYDKFLNPIEYDEFGNPIEYDEFGDPIEKDRFGNVIEYDKFSNPIEYDQYGDPIEKDKFGNPIDSKRYGNPLDPYENNSNANFDPYGGLPLFNDPNAQNNPGVVDQWNANQPLDPYGRSQLPSQMADNRNYDPGYEQAYAKPQEQARRN